MKTPLPAAFLRAPIAHRALHDRARGRIENSASAVRAARAAGYAVEIDLQLSKDGVPMVFHDEDMARLTGQPGWVWDRTAAELGAVPLLGSEDTVPTLAQVLALVGGAVPLLIELKDQTLTMGPTDGRLEAATVAVLAGYSGPVALMSFNPHCLAHLSRLAPHLPRGITTSAYGSDWAPLDPATCAALREIPDYDRVGASFISHEAADLARPRVAELKAAGARVLCWTIRSAEDEAKARQVAENITFEGYAAAFA
ncbi:glycerophosphodiester phosphodiesterase family protein [Rhodobacter sp. KR11]|uniref:glycerophosphodiester phosphodiesterase family protein n=1 Tax=Rhodobacter sp. KR11 TaxID=2974588 RepID=UPI00222308C9|nr:glycerophosphodiester phosphodiesterase family protein [Rhodobacter sp. KR11]MCW1918374.1 glycerophosphodiester phosphodiesterase family protein [Rhodobacter sp. KR11]